MAMNDLLLMKILNVSKVKFSFSFLFFCYSVFINPFEVSASILGSIPKSVDEGSSLYKDTNKICGSVTDDNGEPMPGASVLIKGTHIGTITDVYGKFSLNYPLDIKEPLLVISFVGMKTETIKIKNKKNIEVSLTSLSSDLDEVVVIGYGKAKIKDLTGSVSRINQKEIELSPMTSNVSGMLQGKAAGVNVMISNASPTSPVSVVIRGQSSLSGDGQPLWVIDGVPQYSAGMSGDISNTLYNLNLNDVQSIDILKDASATAIYGSRAANGVVIVTTKSGSEGMRPVIDFKSTLGWQQLNSNGFKTLTPEQYIEYSKQANILEVYRLGTMSTYNKKYMDFDKFNQLNTSQWDMSDLSDMWLPNAYYDGSDDYWDIMTQNALTQEYNISLRGGTSKNSYFASVNYKDQDGIVKGSNSRYIGSRFNFEIDVSDKIKFGLNMNASAREANNKDALISKIIKMRPDYPAYNEDGSINTIDYYTKNPLIELLDKNYSEYRSLNASTFLEYKIFPFLKYRSTFNINYSNVKTDYFLRRYYDDDTNQSTQRATQNSVFVWDNLLTYYKTIGKHYIQALLGHSVEKLSTDFLSAQGSDFPDDDILTNLSSAAIKGTIDSNEFASALVSAFARMQYKYNNRYLLTATYRADGSSKFGKNNRWGYFPSVAFGWIMTEEDFMQALKPYFSYLKLRASYGLTGSQNLGYYDYSCLLSSNTYNGNPGTSPSSLGNNELQWEAQKQTDIGADYGFWDDRIRGTIGWYRKYVDNLITSCPVPISSAFSSVKQNVGAISNTGLEFDITLDLIKNKDLTWSANFNAAHNRGVLEKLNDVTNYLGGTATSNYKLEEGGELGTFYGYVDAGRFYENNEEVWALKPIDLKTGKPANLYRSTALTEGEGDIYVVDLNGDGVITADGDRTYLGNSNPDVFGGFGSTVYWKGLMANITFTYAIGGKRYWVDEANTFRGTYIYNAPNFVMDSWTMKGSEATYPVVTHYYGSGGIGGNNVFTNRWLHNASYVRLSALNISYRLPSKWFKRSLIKGIEATFQATNLFTWTGYPGMDPQGNFSTQTTYLALNGLGSDYSTYPPARVFNFGLKLTIK